MGNEKEGYGGKRLTASALRANIYKVLDEVLATGEAVEIERYGEVLRIVPADRAGGRKRHARLANLPAFDLVSGDPEDLVHLDWSGTWRP